MKYLLFLIVLLSSFSISRAEKPVLVASIFPLADIAREVAGNDLKVRLLLPPGADPHSWEPTPADLLTLQKARFLFAVGGGLEPWLEDLLSGLKAKNLKIILVLKRKSPPHKNHHHHEDPHVWLDFPVDARLCQLLARNLAEAFPEKASSFLKRGEEAAQKYEELHLLFARTLKSCRYQLVPLAGHDAFRAWEKNYGLRFISLAGLSPEAEPTPQSLHRVITLMRKFKIPAIFYDEPQALKFARLIARETGAQIYYLTPGASLTREEIQKGLRFRQLMLENLKRLSLGLRCSGLPGQI